MRFWVLGFLGFATYPNFKVLGFQSLATIKIFEVLGFLGLAAYKNIEVLGFQGLAANHNFDVLGFQKRASREQRTRFQPIPASDLLAVCSSHVRLKWQKEWESSGPSKLKVIKPRLAAWSSSLRTSRREEVQLCRLRIGHTLATHRYLLCGNTRPLCSFCGDNLTVAHVLVSCRFLASERGRFFGSTSLSMKELLDDCSGHISQVLNFLAYLNFSIIFSRNTVFFRKTFSVSSTVVRTASTVEGKSKRHHQVFQDSFLLKR